MKSAGCGSKSRPATAAERGSVSGKLRRVGEFDWVLLEKSVRLNAPTDIALTFADYLDKRNREARRFEQLTEPTIRFVEEVERVAGAPVTLISTRFHTRSIIDRRSW
jgi:adenylosuccinate synthase